MAVTQVVRSPGDLLAGDIKFKKLKRLVDISLCEDDGFKAFKDFAGQKRSE